ncbi:MAG: toll/interleukin-1 receptor domain-containing protein [Gammaproteobacteria bacterium]
MNPGTVFISHSSRSPDFEFAQALEERLSSTGLDVWWDKGGLEDGSTFTAEIVAAIIRQYHFVFILSENSVASQWCRREVARAVDLAKSIVPIRVDDLPNEQSPLELAGLSYIDGRQGLDVCFGDVSRALGLGLSATYDPSSDPFARDGRLLQAIAGQLRYGRTFTNALNLVRLLSNIGTQCCETQRAKAIFAEMLDRRHYTGMHIDYDKVSEYLAQAWHE